MKKVRQKKGFTLMEMLIVVAIIGILVAIAIPTFNSTLSKAEQAKNEANVRAYYAETMVAYMLGEIPALPTKNAAIQALNGDADTPFTTDNLVWDLIENEDGTCTLTVGYGNVQITNENIVSLNTQP